MIEHVGIYVNDLGASVAFYQEALVAIGFALCTRDEGSAGFGAPGAPRFWLSATDAAPTARAHICFSAPDRGSVAKFHQAGQRAGGRDNGGPGLRPDYGPTYYAAYLFDPDGNNVEALCDR